jgi:hypothetical protein
MRPPGVAALTSPSGGQTLLLKLLSLELKPILADYGATERSKFVGTDDFII